MRRFGAVGFATAMLTIAGCGPTIGDACTTAADCGNQLCLNQPYAPGGYCSKACSLSDEHSCPSGSTCVANGNGEGNHACFRLCGDKKDCRAGYECRQRGAKMICIAGL
jgi:hypothetical protein